MAAELDGARLEALYAVPAVEPCRVRPRDSHYSCSRSAAWLLAGFCRSGQLWSAPICTKHLMKVMFWEQTYCWWCDEVVDDLWPDVLPPA